MPAGTEAENTAPAAGSTNTPAEPVSQAAAATTPATTTPPPAPAKLTREDSATQLAEGLNALFNKQGSEKRDGTQQATPPVEAPSATPAQAPDKTVAAAEGQAAGEAPEGKAPAVEPPAAATSGKDTDPVARIAQLEKEVAEARQHQAQLTQTQESYAVQARIQQLQAEYEAEHQPVIDSLLEMQEELTEAWNNGETEAYNKLAKKYNSIRNSEEIAANKHTANLNQAGEAIKKQQMSQYVGSIVAKARELEIESLDELIADWPGGKEKATPTDIPNLLTAFGKAASKKAVAKIEKAHAAEVAALKAEIKAAKEEAKAEREKWTDTSPGSRPFVPGNGSTAGAQIDFSASSVDLLTAGMVKKRQQG